MSESVTPAETAAAQAASNDSLMNPQFLLATFTMLIVAGMVAAIMWKGDDGNIKLVIGYVFGAATTISSFFFGSSKSSQAKDTALVAQLPSQPAAVVVPVKP